MPAGGSGRRASIGREGRSIPPPALERGARESWPEPCPLWPPCWRERLPLAEVHRHFLLVGEGCPDWSKLDAIGEKVRRIRFFMLDERKNGDLLTYCFLVCDSHPPSRVWFEVLLRLLGKGSSYFN